MKHVRIGKRLVGQGHPTYIIGEIGINHNGDIQIAKKLIDMAVACGADAVKFQKRTPGLCVPEAQKSLLRETPWGTMTYLDYKKRIEFGMDEYTEIDQYCREVGIDWFGSPWDIPSVEFLERFNPVCIKIASAMLTNKAILSAVRKIGCPVILSTGMSTVEEIESAVETLETDQLLIAHATSAYPCSFDELNLRMIQTLTSRYNVPIGYSGHEKGIHCSIAAVGLGASHVERHITLDRTMWGTDHSASLEKRGFETMVRDIRLLERALGDGVKVVYESEIPIREKLRR